MAKVLTPTGPIDIVDDYGISFASDETKAANAAAFLGEAHADPQKVKDLRREANADKDPKKDRKGN